MKKVLISVALMAVSSASFADSLVYGGASFGQSKLGDGNGSSFTAHVGTGILPFIGVEAGYSRSGEMDTATNETSEVNTTYVALKPSLDFGPLHVYAKGGLHSWESETKNTSGTTSDDGIDIMYGVGAEYYLMGPVSIGASFQTYTVDDEKLTNFTINGTIHFL
jgi:hypothetical protein